MERGLVAYGARGDSVEKKRSSYTTITVKRETFNKLLELKQAYNAKTWDELLLKLVEAANTLQELLVKERVKKIMCNDLKEASGALKAWAKLLSSKFKDAQEVAIAMTYLKPSDADPAILVVDAERCLE
jgi:hypothetical protein